MVITASWEDLAAVVFVSNKFMSSCVICVVIAREIFLLQSACPQITKVYNKFKNNNKNGNLTLLKMLLMTSCGLFCSQWMSFGQNFAAAGLPTNLRNAQLASFFLIRLYFAACWIRTLKGNADTKIGQFFAGFFHILKRRKTALQLKRRQLYFAAR